MTSDSRRVSYALLDWCLGYRQNLIIDCHYGAIMLFLLGLASDYTLVVPLHHFDSASLYHFDSASVLHNGLSFCKKMYNTFYV